MTITKERADVLSAYLNADMDRTQKLLSMSAEDALAEINADGMDFTVEELKEYGEELKAALEAQQENNGELSEDSLDNVSGGSVIAASVAIGLFGVGYKMGSDLAKRWGW